VESSPFHEEAHAAEGENLEEHHGEVSVHSHRRPATPKRQRTPRISNAFLRPQNFCAPLQTPPRTIAARAA